jgi:hypothetical protein
MTEASLPQESIFAAALELPVADRAAFLDKACAGNLTLCAEVAELLRVHDRSGGVLDLTQVQVTARDDNTLNLPELPGYDIQDELGRGGMGIVYRAFDRRRQEVVALKVMQQFDAQTLFRFKQEFRALADLSHPNLVGLYDLVGDETRWFFTMELVEGTDFLTHVRENEGALRSALGQLAQGLTALHTGGKVHRDVKPSNVLVTAKGRVVLLDFGLAMDWGLAGAQVKQMEISGTAAYMAPEQAVGKGLSPASDWYAVGVMLFEALTGQRPFAGSVARVLRDKQESDPPSVTEMAPTAPADLAQLCADLLQRNPSARSTGAEVLQRLEARPTDPSGVALSAAVPFLGRTQQLKLLTDALAAAPASGPTVVCVHGPSGVGKSALVRHFLDRVVSRGLAVVLAGRCYQQESVPYKALDGVVDDLVRHLRSLSPEAGIATQSEELAALIQLFPVLGEVGPRTVGAEIPDRREQRQRAFAALRVLMARLATRNPLVIAIDDLQWGDLDSAALLVELTRPPEAPPLLLLLSYRSVDTARSPCLAALLPALRDRRDLAVEPLTPTETCDLALAILGSRDEAAVDRAKAVARESGGNPFFVCELVQEHGAGGIESLDDALWARAGRLPEEARRLLEVVAVAAAPLRPEDAWPAAGLSGGQRAALALLRTGRWLRVSGSGGADEVETYHDRVRETVVARLSPATLQQTHGRLAAVLEASGRADAEALATHFEGAGQTQRAGQYYGTAAARATEALAFNQAARLYRKALELRPGDAVEERALRSHLGDALVNAGRGSEAATEYLQAAAGAERGESLELQQRAAQQYLVSGHLDDGLRVLRAVLDSVDMKLPRTPRSALLSLLFRRIQLWFRGIRFQERDAGEVAIEDLRRIDICWSVATGFGVIDVIRGADFQTRGLLLALRAGEPYRIARALGMEAAYISTLGSIATRRTTKLLKAQEELTKKVGRPHADGMAALNSAVAAFLRGRWRESLLLCEKGDQVFRATCKGVAWEIDSVQLFGLSSLWHLGEIAELNRRLPLLMKDARDRGDLYALVSFGTIITPFVQMAADDPSGARSAIEEALGLWSHQDVHVQHAYALYRQGEIDLYEGRASAAGQRAGELWKAITGALLHRVQDVRISARDLRMRSALAAATDADNPDPLLLAAERDAQCMEREMRLDCTARAKFTRASVAILRGNVVLGAALLAEAAAGFDAADMPLNSAAVRRQLGGLLGGESGRSLMAQADSWMIAQQVRNPARMSMMLAPGVPS